MYLTEFILEECNAEGKDLTCKIEKEKLIESLYYNGEIFELYFYFSSEGLYKFSCVLDIKINYNIFKKEDVFVEVTKLLQKSSDSQNYIPYETNVTSISNIISSTFSYNTSIGLYSCKMKKTTSEPLLFLCYNNDLTTKPFSLGENKTEVILNDIHIKYNFRIQPVNRPEIFTMDKEGSRIIVRYPTKLDFYKNDLIQINFLMTKPENTRGIRLNSDSEELVCVHQNNEIKKCSVPRSHFNGKKSGYYYTYYSNRENALNTFYYISPIFVSLPKEDEIIINIKKEYNKSIIKIGNKGTIVFITDYYDNNNIFNSSDIEEKSKFKAEFLINNKHEANCRLWKPKNENIRMICKFDENLENGYIKLNRVILEYNGKKFYIYSEENLIVEQLNSNITFLYSDKQEINILEDKQYYDLKFKIEEYNNEVLFLQKKEKNEDMYLTELILEECNVEGKDLTCKIEKEKLIESLYYNGEIFELYFYFSSEGLYKFSCVLDIKINYNISKKEDVFVEVTKLLQMNLDSMKYIPYETNITSISNVISKVFDYDTNIDLYSCRMKKATNEPLLLLCFKRDSEAKSSLGKNKTEVILNDIHIKYNFRIQPLNRPEEFTMNNEGSRIIVRYPTKLDLNKNDSIPIYFIMYEPNNTRGLRLNPDAEELECKHPTNNIKNCSVPRSHFDGKKSGYYYTYYSNGENGLNIFYDISPIYVDLPKEKEKTPDNSNTRNLAGIIAGSVVGGVVLIAIIVFLVVRYYKRKKVSIDDFSEKEDNKLLLSPKDEGSSGD